jgi:hypothetical protein
VSRDDLEDIVLRDVMRTFGMGQNFRLFRLNNGGARTAEGGFVRFGVPGSPDAQGILGGPEICPHCNGVVREQRGAWIGLETKRPVGGVMSEQQKLFHSMAKSYGARIEVVKSVQEAEHFMREWGAEWRRKR